MEGLNVKDIQQWVRERVNIIIIFQITNSKKSQPRMVCQLVNSLLKEEFLVVINDKWKDESRIKKGNLKIMTSEEFVEIFKNSKPISISKGKTYFLMRRPKENWGSKGNYWWNREWVRDERGGQNKGKIRRTFNKDSAWRTRQLRIDKKITIFSKAIKFGSIQLRWGVQWIFLRF